MRRHLQSIGLVSLYGQDLNFQYCVKLIYTLSYFPAGEVRNCFKDVVIHAFKELKRRNTSTIIPTKLTWIGRADRQPTYALKTLNK